MTREEMINVLREAIDEYSLKAEEVDSYGDDASFFWEERDNLEKISVFIMSLPGEFFPFSCEGD